MRVFTVSDVHIDYQDNRKWLSSLSAVDYLNDILILSGDMTDNLLLMEQCFSEIRNKFLQVFFVPGNHELWIRKNEADSSFRKFDIVCRLAEKHGIQTKPMTIGELSIVPLFSWYDFSFGQPCRQLKDSWVDFRACKWPAKFDLRMVTQYFLNLNKAHLDISNKTVISFSHFLPRIDLMPTAIPQEFRFLYPVLGSKLLDDQIRDLNPDLHIFGHSHVNSVTHIGPTKYINNAYAYPSESNIARKKLLCVHRT